MKKPRVYFKDGLWRCSDNADPIFCGAGATPKEAFKDYLRWRWRHQGYEPISTLRSGDHLQTRSVDYVACPSCGAPGLYCLGNDYTHSYVLPHDCPGGNFDSRQPGGKGNM